MAMPEASRPGGAHAPQSASPSTLRAALEARQAGGYRMSVSEAVAVLVPVCLDLQQRHARGERLYVHASAIVPSAGGQAYVDPRLAGPPTHPLDRHCLAPELQRSQVPGDACASVYSVGALLYEMVTGQHVGPAMRRPLEVDPSLPPGLEVLIGKAIIGDHAHRPADLGALASALYQLAPGKSLHPPDVSSARLDASAELEVDVRLSMLPQNELPSRPAAAAAPPSDPTAILAALKARLESDPRPRYVVNKDRMDHGPFNAVELLQQIAAHTFKEDDVLRDEIGGEQLPLGEWEEFAPFARQASLLREKRAEQKAVVQAVQKDKKQGIAKTIVAASLVAVLVGALAFWFLKVRGTRNEDVVVSDDLADSIDVNGDIKGKKHAAHAGGGHAGGGYAGGMSYEQVLNSNNETISMGESAGGPDLTNAQLSAPLRSASFISGCGAPDSMKVQVRAAVKMGVPIGVTVTTNPANGAVASCIDRAVRGLRWPANPKTDFVTTNY
jgi:hypothetical protein